MLKRLALTVLTAAAAFAVTATTTATLTPAAAQVTITFGSPPPLRYEVVPAPRPGYVWAPGQWRWVDSRYVWHAGAWFPNRPGYRYVPERWDRRYIEGREQWHYHESHWDRDR
ncbi:MAG: YXWGXW repeat-containing protein [Reyranella sp.]|jgi:hypothetical protein|uniref:hypothetical protein n=1 Tax=Reyranella sp. TaxID=1929291 RepID=UPI0025E2FE9E|nr:hypothetical protein [Reyranella sp.]MBR2817969.1 YXWGXW repeat-containing protein [Reyranella sp.]